MRLVPMGIRYRWVPRTAGTPEPMFEVREDIEVAYAAWRRPRRKVVRG
jgi:hypothetical protein